MNSSVRPLASSTGPIGPKDPLEDGNFIIENFTNRFDEPSDLRGPFIIDFIEKPTLTSARKMLKAYQVHLPLSTLLKKNRKKKSKKIQDGAPNVGAIASASESGKDKRNSGPKSGGKPVTLQYELMVLDTMHDLLDTDPENVYKIFKNEFDNGMPKHLKDAFFKSTYSFTRDAASYVERRANIDVRDVAFNLASKKALDFSLVGLVSSWNNLSFVLDNFADGLRNGGGGPQSQGVLMLIGCAYLIVLLSNMKHLGILPQRNNITFIDGFFMNIDGSYISRFLTLFCKSLKRLTLLNTNVVPFVQARNITRPKYFCKLFGLQVAISKSDIVIDGNAYGVFLQNPLPNQVYWPHSKAQFWQHVRANSSNKDLWYINFLRDAFKADVALETDSVFVTHDRLAFTYYKMIGGKHGFLLGVNLTVGPHQAQLCDYSVAF